MHGLRFDFWDSLLVCGIIQAITVAIVVVSGKRRDLAASWFLSATLLIFGLHNILIVCRDSNLSELYPRIENLPFNLILGFGPCIYFYIFFSLYPSRSHPYLSIHYIPVAIQFSYYLFQTLKGDLHLGYAAWKFISQAEQISALVSVSIYIFFSLKLLNTYGKGVSQTVLMAKPRVSEWLSRLLWAYIFISVVWLFYTLLDIFYFNYRLGLRDYFPLYLSVSGLTYWIGIMAYLHPIIASPGTGNKSYSSRDEREIQLNLRLLQDMMMKERLYFNPDLTLKQVAAKSGIPVNFISFIINNRLNQSFNDWINSYRVGEVKKQMMGSRLKDVTLTSIAYECGFNSKATFNRVFKQQTGQTPRAFLLRANPDK